KIRAIMVGILLAMFLSGLEQSLVAPALPTIGRVLGDVENLSRVVTPYLLACTAVTPLFGKLSDIYGRRRMMLVAIVIFLAGSAACIMAGDRGRSSACSRRPPPCGSCSRCGSRACASRSFR